MASKQKNMTKADLVTEIASRTGINKTEVKIIIEEWMQVIKESLLQDFSVSLRGFGTFFRKKRASKKARNISKGIAIEIPAHEVPGFKASKEFTNQIKNS